MVEFDTNVRICEIISSINEVKESLSQVLQVVKPEHDLWDNSDIIRHWNVSERTLASWRRKKLIAFVQVNGKIWYPREAREEFLNGHLINVNNG